MIIGGMIWEYFTIKTEVMVGGIQENPKKAIMGGNFYFDFPPYYYSNSNGCILRHEELQPLLYLYFIGLFISLSLPYVRNISLPVEQ